jgi:sulfate transport system substrate-binding protein
MVLPSVSILAEPPVAVVEGVAKRRGTTEVAKAYLEFLYTEEGQDIVGRHYYRPRLETALAKYADRFAQVRMFTVDEVFGGWRAAQRTHFSEGGTFDRIYQGGR